MTAAFRRRVNKGKFGRRIGLLLLLVLLVLNVDTVGRFFYPFPYQEATFRYAGAYQLDPFLLAAVMRAESKFDKRAVSAQGARGLMQIMPDTGRWVAGQLGEPAFHPDRLFEPETNIRYGAWYLADLQNEFHGDPLLVLAAYNGGRGNVNEWLSNKDLSGGASTIDQIPFSETRHYVRKVLFNYRVYRYLYGQESDKRLQAVDKGLRC